MTLSARIDLVNALIAEDRDATIADYARAVDLIEEGYEWKPLKELREEWPGYTPQPIGTKWPKARVYFGIQEALSQIELDFWRMRDSQFYRMIVLERKKIVRQKEKECA